MNEDISLYLTMKLWCWLEHESYKSTQSSVSHGHKKVPYYNKNNTYKLLFYGHKKMYLFISKYHAKFNLKTLSFMLSAAYYDIENPKIKHCDLHG